MASVVLKRGKWWIRIKGNKVPGKWSTHPSSCTSKTGAARLARRVQRDIDARLATASIINKLPPKPPPPSNRARIGTIGAVYALRLLPDLAPNRLKVGFTSSMTDRLAQHRVTCPALEVIAMWRGTRADENRAHAVLSGRIMVSEIFDVPDVELALLAIDGVLGERA